MKAQIKSSQKYYILAFIIFNSRVVDVLIGNAHQVVIDDKREHYIMLINCLRLFQNLGALTETSEVYIV